MLWICRAWIWCKEANSSHLVFAPGILVDFAGDLRMHCSAAIYAFLSASVMSCLFYERLDQFTVRLFRRLAMIA